MLESAILIGVFIVCAVAFLAIVKWIEEAIKAKCYKKAVEQVVNMLRSYNSDHGDYPDVDTAVDNITHSIFTEMLLSLPKEYREELRQRYNMETE